MDETTPDSGLVPVGTVTEYAVMVYGWPMYQERFQLRVIGRPGDDAPRLCIEVTPETGIKDLESAWATIEHWRDALHAAFPAERLGEALRELLLAELSERQRGGESYAALAVWLTGRIEAALRVYLEWLTSIDPALADAWITDSDDKERLWLRHMASGRMPLDGLFDFFHPRYGWVGAMDLLRWFGPQRRRDTLPVGDNERADTLRAALGNLRRGLPAFPKSGEWLLPSRVTAETVTSRVRVWREQRGPSG